MIQQYFTVQIFLPHPSDRTSGAPEFYKEQFCSKKEAFVLDLQQRYIQRGERFAHKNTKMQFLENKYAVWLYTSYQNEKRFLKL